MKTWWSSTRFNPRPDIFFENMNNLDKASRLLISIMLLDDTNLFLPKNMKVLLLHSRIIKHYCLVLYKLVLYKLKRNKALFFMKMRHR